MKRFFWFFCWIDKGSRFVLQEKELHCGDCFQVRKNNFPLPNGPWLDVRIEMSGGRWFLVGVPAGYSTDPDYYEARFYPEGER
jgi:Domain of unknown function (DUF5348)